MEILHWVCVIYVTLDLGASAYVVIKRGGIRAVVSDVRQNLGYTRDTEEYDDVHDEL